MIIRIVNPYTCPTFSHLINLTISETNKLLNYMIDRRPSDVANTLSTPIAKKERTCIKICRNSLKSHGKVPTSGNDRREWIMKLESQKASYADPQGR